MKKFMVAYITLILFGCSADKKVSIDIPRVKVDSSLQSSALQSTATQSSAVHSQSIIDVSTTSNSSRNSAGIGVSQKTSRTPSQKFISVVGNWKSGNRNISFNNGGSGVTIEDDSYGGNTYSYYRQFNWKQKGAKIKVKFTSETAIRKWI